MKTTNSPDVDPIIATFLLVEKKSIIAIYCPSPNSYYNFNYIYNCHWQLIIPAVLDQEGVLRDIKKVMKENAR